MPTVAVAMSGGVDSSIAAAILKKQGYDVIGICMKIWDGQLQIKEEKRHSCYGPGEKEDIDDAHKVADLLEIPFFLFDLRGTFKSTVLDHFCSEYLLGRTPNPCIKCNKHVKFEALFRKAQDAGLEFDFIATGHYSRVEYSNSHKRYLLKKAKDITKDQSYFLSYLSQEQLGRLLLPIGIFTKAEVRKMASELNLSVNNKPESQNFIAGGYHQLLKDHVQPGPILDREGNILGQHKGIQYFTIGQRKNLGVSLGRPMYVIEIDYKKNAIIIGNEKDLYQDELIASDINLISIDNIKRTMQVKAKIRSTHEASDATLTPLETDKVHLRFKEPQYAITPGQTVVFYANDCVIGGGTIAYAA
ncbi:MAG: tRNA 2-thiouridine(34) synthase MnmA [Dehalococcoidia bacterium]|nr:MAG: tRNA 2-thiouridine(34) synthase MnmA [Dehalococcoidia bacterium]